MDVTPSRLYTRCCQAPAESTTLSLRVAVSVSAAASIYNPGGTFKYLTDTA